jgi:hypothetical protein
MAKYTVYLPARGMVSYTVVADNEFNALKKAVSYVPDAADNEIYGNLIDLEPDNLALDVGQTDYKPYCLEGSQSYYYEYTDEEIKAVGLDADADDSYPSLINYYEVGSLVNTYSEAKKAGLPQEILDKIANHISSLLDG